MLAALHRGPACERRRGKEGFWLPTTCLPLAEIRQLEKFTSLHFQVDPSVPLAVSSGRQVIHPTALAGVVKSPSTQALNQTTYKEPKERGRTLNRQ